VLLLTLCLAAVLAGCGTHPPRPAELHLERTDLVLLGGLLTRLERPIQGEVATARTLWPALAAGLPGNPSSAIQQKIATADARAGALILPVLVTQEDGLTGPAAAIGGLLKSYTYLTQRGWQVIATATGAARATGAGQGATTHSGRGAAIHAGAGAVGFLRDNAGLYIYCVYDGHYDLSLIGKQLQAAYRKLGGPPAFGAALTQAQVDGLLRAYSIASVRLVPHPPQSLGV
jgi:hypothetical protein